MTREATIIASSSHERIVDFDSLGLVFWSTVDLRFRPLAPLAGEMTIHLHIQRSLRQRFLQLIEQAIAAKCRFGIRSGQKPVQNHIRDNGVLSS